MKLNPEELLIGFIVGICSWLVIGFWGYACFKRYVIQVGYGTFTTDDSTRVSLAFFGDQ